MPLLNIIPEGDISNKAQTYTKDVLYNLPGNALDAFSHKRWSLIIINDNIGFQQSRYFDENHKDLQGFMDPYTRRIGVLESLILKGHDFEKDDIIHHEFAHFLFHEFFTVRQKLFVIASYQRNLRKLRNAISENKLIQIKQDRFSRKVPHWFPVHKYFITKAGIADHSEYFSECFAAYHNDIPKNKELLLSAQIATLGRPHRGICYIMPSRRRLKKLHPETIPFIDSLFN